MSKYTSITQQEMEEFLGVTEAGTPKLDSLWRFYRMQIPNVYEQVYGWKIRDNLTLRIYTTISTMDHASRDKGNDAIRSMIFYRDHAGEIVKVSSCKKVLRVEGWRKNLTQRIEEVYNECIGPNCTTCQAPMVRRYNSLRKNFFFGCCRYPECVTTVSIT